MSDVENEVVEFHIEYEENTSNVTSMQAVINLDYGQYYRISNGVIDGLDNRFDIVEDDIIYFCEHMFKLLRRNENYYDAVYIGEMNHD